ncbi:MAG: helix-turn-helix domain-containing protein [Pseudonocardiaceae bacterium]
MDDLTAPAGSVGYRLARVRELAGLTRPQLAARAQLSVTLIGQVERGEVPASVAVTAAVARGLRLDVDALYGRPYGPALCPPDADHAGVPALRAALDHDDPQPTGPLLTPEQLRARLDECELDRAAGRYAQLRTALPDLLQQACALNQVGSGPDTTSRLLSDACLLAHTVAFHFSYLDLAMLATSRARDSAERSGDPLRPAVVAGEHTRLRCHRGDYPDALRLAERAHTAIANEHSPAADAVRVQLHLHQAIAHARAGTPDRADHHLDVARELTTRGIPPSPYYTVTASTAAVDICQVAVAVELTDPATALDHAQHLKIPTGEPPALIGCYFVDLARAWTLRGDHDRAFAALQHARAHAPQVVRYHPQARETLYHLAEIERRNPDSLAGFARWAGAEPSPTAD